MTDAPDLYEDELRDARARLRELANDLKWFEPSLRARIGNEWHIVRAATFVVEDRLRELDRQVSEHVREREQVPRLPVAGD